ncbi:hypothetical protein QJS10_CPA08g00441 [Acorus calamus]|uniref:CASP-like protein n=1 Tax=Acorus calamus TaxID=4465 RepID=A0AAV9EBM7_ACOCL|nr:hypothetical protein QJS10_CPA08g00441 [Acorus calamus]
MEIDSEKYEQIPSFNEKQKHLEVALRATSVLFILAAFLLMVTDKQTFTFVDVTFSAKFYYSSAFWYCFFVFGLIIM